MFVKITAVFSHPQAGRMLKSSMSIRLNFGYCLGRSRIVFELLDALAVEIFGNSFESKT
jgi:hypothetical protein